MVDSGVPEFPAVSPDDIAAALPILARLDLPLLVHAEDPQLIAAAGAAAAGDPRRYATWLESRPAEAERAAIATLREVARGTGAHVHVVHVTSRAALDELRAAQAAGEWLTGETCPHYLIFAAEDIPDGATGFKCAPPIRGMDEAYALHEGLLDGTLSMIVTDHSPAPPALKEAGGDFFRAWGGIASLEVGAAALMSVEPPYDPWEWCQWMAESPAGLASLGGRKGVLAVGADADFAIWTRAAGRRVTGARLHHRHPWTPYEGLELEWIPAQTWLRGTLVWDGSGFPAGPIGRPLQRALAAAG
jgi:allantoinase